MEKARLESESAKYVLIRHGFHFDVWRTCPEYAGGFEREGQYAADVEMLQVDLALKNVRL